MDIQQIWHRTFPPAIPSHRDDPRSATGVSPWTATPDGEEVLKGGHRPETHFSKRPNSGGSRSRVFAAVCFVLLLVIPATFTSADDETRGPGRERFVPADQLEAIFERSPQGVMLPREEFKDLLAKAQEAQAKLADIPSLIVLRSAAYEVEQSDNHALVKLTVSVEQFADQWVTLRIPIGNMLVEKATIGGTPAAIGRDTEQPGMLTLVHSKPGKFKWELQLSTPLGTVGSDRVAAFQTISNASSVVTVACPENQHVEISSRKLDRPAPIDQPTSYTVPAGGSETIQLKWTARQQQSETQTLVFARTDAQVQLSSDNIRWNSDTRVSVFGSSINQLIARVPSSLEVTAVDSTGLESWKLEDDPDRKGFTRLLLNYRQPFTEDRLIKLSAVAALKSAENSRLPTLELIEVTSHTGRVFVHHEDQLRLIAEVGGGIRHLGTAKESTQRPAGEIFDFWLQDYELSVAVRSRDRELFAELNSTLSIIDTTASFLCEATVETLNAPLFELTLQLPEGWQIGELKDANDAPLKWRTASTDGQIVIEPSVPIPAGGLLAFKAPFTKTIEDPTSPQLLTLPVLTALDALVVGGTYRISAASDLTIAPQEISGLSTISDDGGTLLFETQSTTYSGRLSVVRKPVRVSSRSVLKTWMDTRQKHVEAVVTVDVMNGTTRTLELLLPEDLGPDIRFSVLSIGPVPGVTGQQVPSGIAISEQTPGAVTNGQRAFRLTFDKRFVGALTLQTTVQQPRNEETKLTAPFVNVTGAIRQHGLLAFEAYPEQQLAAVTADISASGLTTADSGLVDAPAEATGRRTALVYQFVHANYSLELSETRFQTETVPSAVCESIANISVLSGSGTIQRSCIVQLRCIGVQTLRFALPGLESSYLWSTILNNEAVEVRRDGDDYLVAIPTGEDRTQHTLEVLFESASDNTSVLGNTTQQSLRIGIDTEKGSNAAIDILQQTWDVRYPSSSMLVNHDGGFHPLSGLEQPGWIQRICAMAYLPSSRDATERLMLPGLFILALFVATVLVIRRRWKSLVCVCLLGLIAGPLMLSGTGTRQYSSDFATDDMVAGSAVEMSMLDGADEEYGGRGFFESEFPDMSMPQAAEPMGEVMLSDQESREIDRFNRPDIRQNNSGSLGRFGGGATSGLAREGFGVNEPGPGEVGADQASQELQSHTIRNAAPNAPPQPAFGSRALTFPQQQDEQEMEGAAVDVRSLKRTGAARLSIRAHVAEPDNYRSMQFRSIGGTAEAGTLQVVVQQRSHIEALRVIAAALILLLCLWMNSASLTTKLCFAVACLMSAAAAAALVPNQLQSAVDGTIIGTLLGIGIWISTAAVCCLRSACRIICSCRCWSFFQSRRATTTAAIIIALTCFASNNAQLTAADEDNKVTRPDIVLPYTPGRPELLADRVFLPQKEFLKLYNQAYPDQLQAAGSPTASRVVAAFYKSRELKQIKDANWSQSFEVRYVVRSFSDDGSNVPLPVNGIAIRSAKLNGSTAVVQAQAATAVPLIQQAPNQQVQQVKKPKTAPAPQLETYSVRIPAAGLHLLDVVFERPVTLENSVGKLVLPLQPVAAGTLVFELPEEKLEARINGRSNTFRQQGKTLTIPVSVSGDTRIEWRPESTQSTSDTIYHATVNSALLMNDTGLTVQSSAKINCRQGQLAEVEISVPKDYAVQKVEGADIAGWNVAEEKPTVLKILFQTPVEGETNVNLTLFRQQTLNSTESIIDVPVPAVLGASRDSGNVSVLAGSELEIRVNSLSGVSQLNAADAVLPDGIDKNLRGVLAWRYTRHPAVISVRAFRTADQLKITVLNGVQLEPQRQLWTTLVSAHISGAPRRRLEVRVPKDFLALDVDANDLADWYYAEAESDGDTKVLNIQFATARLGTVDATIQGQTGREDQVSAKLMAPQVSGADETTTHVSLWLDAASEIVSSEATGWKRSNSDAQIDPQIRALKPNAPDISFSSRNSSLEPITLSLRQAPASLIAESVTVSNVTDTAVKLTLGLNWQISGAATRELSFVIPTELSDVFDFKVPGLRQLEKTVVADGIQITLHLQQPVSQRFFVLGTGTLALPESKQILAQPPTFSVLPNSKANIASQSHFWVIVNQSGGVLEAVDRQTDGSDVGADEIKTTIPEGFLQQSVAIRRLKSDRINSAWQLKFPERQQVAPAVVALAAHTTIIAVDGTWRSRHDLQVRNESRQFLPVILPDNSRILYCLVKGKPTRIVSRTINEQTLYLIPVPQSGEIATPFDVQFALTGSLPETPRNLAGEVISIPVPSFPEYRDFPDYGIMVSRNTWSVHVPSEWQATLLKDPRQSNVVVAGDADFQDVMLFACVDNTRSMLNSLSSASKSIKQSGQGAILWSELNRQKSLLQGQQGNAPSAEGERNKALQEIESLLEEQHDMFGEDVGGFDGVGLASPDFSMQSSGGNRFLELQERTSNTLDVTNNDALFFSNGGSGMAINSAPGSGSDASGPLDAIMSPKFGFALPAIENRTRVSGPDDQAKLGGRVTLEKKGAIKAPAKPANEKGSQLLNRRMFNVEQQKTQGQGGLPGKMGQDAVQFAPEQQAAQQSDPFGSGQQGEGGQQGGDNGYVIIGGELATEGLLSLTFQIPEDGVRHNFVRTGGNAALSLTVRSSDSVQCAMGILWAVGCLIAALLLFKGAFTGSVSIMQRLFFLTAVVGLIGWLCFPDPVRGIGLVLCMGAAICYCLVLISKSFRKPAAA